MSTYDKSATDLKYFNPDEIGRLGLRPDAKVRIVDGIFEGKEGYYQRIKGSRSKCFVVKIDNFLACAAVIKSPSAACCVVQSISSMASSTC